MTCAECGTRYDSDQNAFCPRCGSTAKGQAVPAALQVAQRNDPGRRRVQASGALLLIIGLLFLASAIGTAVLSRDEVSADYAKVLANQDGGTLVVAPGAAASFDVVVTTMGGAPLGNATGATAPATFDLRDHAGVRVQVRADGGAPVNATAIVLAGERLEVAATDVRDGDVLASRSVRGISASAVGLGIAFALVIAAGGLCALLLRWFPLATAAAVLGALVGLFAVFFFLFAGLLFAIPFGFAATFILRGRRHFRKKGE